jgi:hypothetical protein
MGVLSSVLDPQSLHTWYNRNFSFWRFLEDTYTHPSGRRSHLFGFDTLHTIAFSVGYFGTQHSNTPPLL